MCQMCQLILQSSFLEHPCPYEMKENNILMLEAWSFKIQVSFNLVKNIYHFYIKTS